MPEALATQLAITLRKRFHERAENLARYERNLDDVIAVNAAIQSNETIPKRVRHLAEALHESQLMLCKQLVKDAASRQVGMSLIGLFLASATKEPGIFLQALDRLLSKPSIRMDGPQRQDIAWLAAARWHEHIEDNEYVQEGPLWVRAHAFIGCLHKDEHLGKIKFRWAP